MATLTEVELKEIVDNLDTGFLAYWNTKSNEIIYLPNENDLDMMDDDLFEEDLEKVKSNPKKFKTFEPMPSHVAFEVMESFADMLNVSSPYKSILFGALSKNKPFSRFNQIVHDAPDLRQAWFDHKAEQQLNWVKQQYDTFLKT